MRFVIAGILCVLAIPSEASARVGEVVIAPDDVTYSCNVVDVEAGIQELYIAHFNFSGPPVSGLRFRLESSPGMTMTYLGEEHYAPVLAGDTQSGITFCYGSCVGTLLVRLAKVTYMRYGTSGCSSIKVAPHPDSNTIDVLLCDGTPSYADGRSLYVNYCAGPICDGRYYGHPTDPFVFCAPVAAKQTTWGAIKSLYR
jgi:hypothetical protein